MSNPIVSVILCTRDGARYLAEAMDSVLAQDYRDLELIAIDDGSDDATPGILAGFVARDPRVRTARTDKIGLTRALNLGLGMARGRYVARHDDDDFSLPTRIGEQVRYLESHPACVLVGCGHAVVDESGHTLSIHGGRMDSGRLREELLRGNRFCHGTLVARKDLLERLGGYRPRFRYAQDYDLVLRASENGEVAILPGIWYQWRSRSGGISSEKKLHQLVFAIVAKTFALERKLYGGDSYDAVSWAGRDDLESLEAFFKGHRMGRRFAWAACKALAGKKGGAAILVRLGVHPALAYCAAVPKAGFTVFREIGGRLRASAWTDGRAPI